MGREGARSLRPGRCGEAFSSSAPPRSSGKRTGRPLELGTSKRSGGKQSWTRLNTLLLFKSKGSQNAGLPFNIQYRIQHR